MKMQKQADSVGFKTLAEDLQFPKRDTRRHKRRAMKSGHSSGCVPAAPGASSGLIGRFVVVRLELVQ